MNEKCKKDNEMLKAFDAIQTENQKLHNTLQDIVLVRKSLEDGLTSADKNLSLLFQEEQNLEAVRAIQLMKIQSVENEIFQLEDKQKALTENIQEVDLRVKDYKENLESKINDFTKEADHLCQLFLSSIHNGTSESECSKVREETNKLKLEIEKKEEALVRVQRELEEYVILEAGEAVPEFDVTQEERDILLNVMESQYLSAASRLEDLNRMKSEKLFEEYQHQQES